MEKWKKNLKILIYIDVLVGVNNVEPRTSSTKEKSKIGCEGTGQLIEVLKCVIESNQIILTNRVNKQFAAKSSIFI